ncbi:MAG: NAD(P)-dependent oxidoreductase [Gammaproteobacteria bacterium]|nr:NAD(P)-dependent oxidoreductase [Gammaproteobacteria bacterium]
MSESALNKLQTDLHAPLTRHEASVEADRCYFCFDAPCVTACPTGIDIPLFIRQIKTDNPKGAATTIFNDNIFGGMCARVCPTETLCEEKCVRTVGEEKPVLIGQLQRYATDVMMATGKQPFTRAAERSTKIAVVGAGPAGLSCAHRLALHGHQVKVFDAADKPGGLNEYGIAAYKTIDDFAAREVNYILSIGGIEVVSNQVLGKDITLERLKADYDAVFLGMGLADVNVLGILGSDLEGVQDAVQFIAQLRQATELSALQPSIGKHVVVIGGGMTAIDAAVQSKMLGAENVTVVYRRAQSDMNASEFEQQLAQKNGVLLRTHLQPQEILGAGGQVTGIRFEYTSSNHGSLTGNGETLDIECDRLLVAIGQQFLPDSLTGSVDVALQSNRIKVDADRRTSDERIWAGGDCILGGEDLTVAAVQDGKLAAESIHSTLENVHG